VYTHTHTPRLFDQKIIIIIIMMLKTCCLIFFWRHKRKVFSWNI